MSRVFGMIKNVRNFPAYLLHKWGITNQHPFILHSHNGVSVEVPDRMMHTAKEVFFTDDYKFDQIQRPVLNLSSEPIVIDVGANVGYLSAFTFTRFQKARVFSVEPIPNNLELLRRNKERNNQFNWNITEGVLSDKNESLEIQFDKADSFSTSASMYGLDKSNHSIMVKSQTLDNLVAENGLKGIHILKLDCEGAEYDILYCLRSELLNSIAFITMETHQIDVNRKNRNSLVSWLNGKGWKTDVIRSKVLASNPNFKNA
ncbi:MAG: FkbM family methyltransferase [Bacteroidia bacterium]|jgi:FkbM family methyltransferase